MTDDAGASMDLEEAHLRATVFTGGERLYDREQVREANC